MVLPDGADGGRLDDEASGALVLGNARFREGQLGRSPRGEDEPAHTFVSDARVIGPSPDLAHQLRPIF